MEKLDNALYQWIVIYTNLSISNFLIFIHFTNQKSLKPSLAQNLIFQSGPTWGIKDEETFIRCYTIALKPWDEFNVNFVLLYFSSYCSVKMWHFFLKNVEKNNKDMFINMRQACGHWKIGKKTYSVTKWSFSMLQS